MSFVKETTSTAIIPYYSPEVELERSKQRMHDLFMERSFQAQILDKQKLNSISVKGAVLAGVAIEPKNSPTLPKPFDGTREKLLDQITPTVHETINNLDYNGLMPYLKLIDQLNAGKSFREIVIDSREESPGSTCVGMSHALLKSLKDKHHVEGMLAVQRQISERTFEHGAVIVECSDGFVLLDTRSDPKTRIFSIPFESTVHYGNLSLTASKPGSQIPISMTYAKTHKYPAASFEYGIGVANGDDLVMKHFVMDACDYFIAIACYNPDGSARKHIKIYFNESKIDFFDNKTCLYSISFKDVLKEEFGAQLAFFMEPRDYCTLPRFHLSVETLHDQLVRFVSSQEKIKKLAFQVCFNTAS